MSAKGEDEDDEKNEEQSETHVNKLMGNCIYYERGDALMDEIILYKDNISSKEALGVDEHGMEQAIAGVEVDLVVALVVEIVHYYYYFKMSKGKKYVFPEDEQYEVIFD